MAKLSTYSSLTSSPLSTDTIPITSGGATRNVSISKFIGSLPSVSNAIISRNDGTGVMTAVTSDGTTYTHSTDLLSLINTLQGVLPEPCTITILPSTGTYKVGAAIGTGTILIDTTILAYGVRIFADTLHTGGEIFKVTVNQKSLRVFGADIDNNKKFGNVIGGGSVALYAPKLIHVRDCIIRNIYSYGVRVTDEIHDATSTLIVENTQVDAGGSNSLNECIETNQVTSINLTNVKCTGNKLIYTSGDTCIIDGFVGDCTGYTGTVDCHVQCSKIDIRNIQLTESLLLMRPYGSTETNTPTASAKYMRIDGFYSNNASVQALRIDTYNDTTGSIDELSLRNLNIARGEVTIDIYRNSGPSQIFHGYLGIVDIENLTIGTFNSNKGCILVRDNSIGILRIANVQGPSTLSSDSTSSIVRVENSTFNVDIASLDMSNVYPQPTNVVRVGDGSTGNSCTFAITRTIISGSTAHTTSGTPAVTKTISTPQLLAIKLTTTQRDALTVGNGLVIYNTTLNKFQGYENGAWVNLI